MKEFVRCCVTIFLLCSLTPVEQKEWDAHFLERIHSMPEVPTPEDIELLATLAANAPRADGSNPVKDLAWQRLSAIPDFPDQLARRVKESREKWVSGKQDWNGYDRDRMRAIRPMGGLPRPDVVRVLGEFLFDLEQPAGAEPAIDVALIPPNGVFAANALGKLLDNTPVPEKEDATRADVETWQLWYEQVKAGNRTFRFKGDPKEYNLLGPVSSALVPAGKEPTNGSRPNVADGKRAETGSASIAVVIAACGVLGLAALAFLKGRRRNAA